MTAHRPNVLSVMTPFPYSVSAEESVETARAMMEQHDIHHLPVMRGGALWGILSARDVAVCFDLLGDAKASLPPSVAVICTRDPYVVEVDAALDAVADELANRHIGSAIVTKHGKLAGIVTVTDVCRALAGLLRELAPSTVGDDVA